MGNRLKRLTGAVVGIFVLTGPTLAADLGVRYRAQGADVPRFVVDYNHNYGPTEFFSDGIYVPPDRIITNGYERPYAYYDGHRRHCAQSAPNYIGQDRRRHPCN